MQELVGDLGTLRTRSIETSAEVLELLSATKTNMRDNHDAKDCGNTSNCTRTNSL